MRVGLNLLNAGDASSYSALSRIAQHAEDLGYDSLWVTEQEPFPVTAQQPVFTGELVVSRKPVTCTLEALAIAAVQTERIRLGISLPNIPFYSPIEIGTSLAALDVLSDGRVQVGLGLGWTSDEFQTVASALTRSETPANEFVRALRTVWDGCENGFAGGHYAVPRSTCELTPIQQPYPPIVLTAFAPAAVQPAATLLRGGSPLVTEMSVHEMAGALRNVAHTGQDVVVRAVVRLTEEPLGEERAMFSGSFEQIADDVAQTQSLGVAELEFDLSGVVRRYGCQRMLDLMGQLRELVPVSGQMPASFQPASVAA